MNKPHFLIENNDGIVLITFNHIKPTNPFTLDIQRELISFFQLAEEDDRIRAVILYGGQGRSFSAGGDFAENIENNNPEDIAVKLNLVCDFYIELLKFSKPLICAIHKYAIGMGFQVAILGDYRIGTSETVFRMPELVNGVAVPLGSAMTEFLYGRFIMQKICFGCAKIPAQQCLEWHLVDEILDESALIVQAKAVAERFANYPEIPFRGSKKSANQRFIAIINQVRQDTINVHTATFMSGQHRQYMQHILTKNKISV